MINLSYKYVSYLIKCYIYLISSNLTVISILNILYFYSCNVYLIRYIIDFIFKMRSIIHPIF
nr:MAG TPA: hypothetical protein [Caudoviricetes sp.]